MATVMYPKQIKRRAWDRLNPDHTISGSRPRMLRRTTDGLEAVPVLSVERDDLFHLGRLVATQHAVDMSYQLGAPSFLSLLVQRHHAGDWGELDTHDNRLNDESVVAGGRLLSSYTVEGETFWVITEADRSVTTVLMREDY